MLRISVIRQTMGWNEEYSRLSCAFARRFYQSRICLYLIECLLDNDERFDAMRWFKISRQNLKDFFLFLLLSHLTCDGKRLQQKNKVILSSLLFAGCQQSSVAYPLSIDSAWPGGDFFDFSFFCLPPHWEWMRNDSKMCHDQFTLINFAVVQKANEELLEMNLVDGRLEGASPHMCLRQWNNTNSAVL